MVDPVDKGLASDDAAVREITCTISEPVDFVQVEISFPLLLRIPDTGLFINKSTVVAQPLLCLL